LPFTHTRHQFGCPRTSSTATVRVATGAMSGSTSKYCGARPAREIS
jgi:hypothetical protein